MSTDISTPELRRMSPDELRKEVVLRKAECAKMRIGLKAQSEKNHALYHNKRREIARLLTVLGELGRNGRDKMNKKTKEIQASQFKENAVKDPGSKVEKAKSAPTKSRKSSLSSLSSEASAKEDSSPS